MKKFSTYSLVIPIVVVLLGALAIKRKRDVIARTVLEHEYSEEPLETKESSQINDSELRTNKPASDEHEIANARQTNQIPVTLRPKEKRAAELKAAVSTSIISECLAQDVDMRYALLYPQLSLDTQKTAMLKALLAQYLLAGADPPSPVAPSQEAVDGQIKDLLGDFDYYKFASYQKDSANIKTISQLQSLLASQDMPLTQEQLIKIGAELSLNSSVSHEVMNTDANPARGNETGLEQASKHLNEKQKNLLRNLYAQDQAQMDLAKFRKDHKL